jgi:hypothetical protein
MRALEMHRQGLDRLVVVCQINPGAIAQAAIAPDIKRLEVWLAHDREPALKRKPVFCCPFSAPLGRSSTCTS